MYFNVKNIRFIRFSKKLNYKYYNFYIIVELIDKMIYKFEFSFLLSEIHDVFHVSLLKFISKNKNTKTSYIKINKKSKWKIKIIVNMKKKNCQRNFLIKWLKYSHSNN